MKLQREEMYFEPRVVDSFGGIRWFGGTYSDKAILDHCGHTVYIRDDGDHIFVYCMTSDDLANERSVNATFNLITKIKKHESKYRYRYGKRITG